MQKKIQIIPCCIDCPNAGKWQKKFTDPALTIDNTCQRYLSCHCYNQWWFNPNLEIDTTGRLEVFNLEE